MVGVTKIPVTTKEFNDYKKLIYNNKNITLSTYFAKIIKKELTQVKKQRGKCIIHSTIKQKGEIKGSCRWNKEYYKVIIWQWDKTKQKSSWSKSLGYFDDLYHAEQTLTEIFSVETEEEIFKKFEEKKIYYQKKYKLEKNPTLNETTYTIKSIHKSKLNSKKKKSISIEFKKKFTNPKTNKHQKTICFGRQFLDEYTADAIINECIEKDDPIQILDYRTKLELKVNPMKYIHKNSKNIWKIYKKNIIIGPYKDLEEAQNDRDILVINKWNKKIIEKINKKFHDFN
ncbi:MAG: hypothetical protein E7Z84_08995 [Methanosphaera stadtmanae]|nr:hypothetical protein [Methanosphaera stadtmanae]